MLTITNERKFQGMRFWDIMNGQEFVGQLSCAKDGWNKWAVLAGEVYQTFTSKDKALAFAEKM